MPMHALQEGLLKLVKVINKWGRLALAAPRAGPLVPLQALHSLESSRSGVCRLLCSEQRHQAVPQAGHCAGARRGRAWVSHRPLPSSSAGSSTAGAAGAKSCISLATRFGWLAEGGMPASSGAGPSPAAPAPLTTAAPAGGDAMAAKPPSYSHVCLLAFCGMRFSCLASLAAAFKQTCHPLCKSRRHTNQKLCEDSYQGLDYIFSRAKVAARTELCMFCRSALMRYSGPKGTM